MGFGFIIPAVLIGLVAVLIPPLIHLLNRRRYDVVDWGAMQFLEVSETTRRRLFIEELILMLLRMTLIAILVLAIAGPWMEWSGSSGRSGGSPLGRSPRDVVLLLDGSGSMGLEVEEKDLKDRDGDGITTLRDKSLQWAEKFVEQLPAGSGIAVVQAGEAALPIIPTLISDKQTVLNLLKEKQRLPSIGGTADWPLAMRRAADVLQRSGRAQRDVVLVSDQQKHGWADERSLRDWEGFATWETSRIVSLKPNYWVAQLAPEKDNKDKKDDKPIPNWSLAHLQVSRALVTVNQEVTFNTAILLNGQSTDEPPHKLSLSVDGEHVRNLESPLRADKEKSEAAKGQLPITFNERFASPGTHLVTVTMTPDDPAKKNEANYKVKDRLALDNQRHLVIEVVRTIPVLIVDGDTQPKPMSRGSDVILDALVPEDDSHPVMLAQVITVEEFIKGTKNQLKERITPTRIPLGLKDIKDDEKEDLRPRVLILHNVPELNRDQDRAVQEFLRSGGGVWVCLGNRVNAKNYNEKLYRRGEGWLPAELDQIIGEEDEIDTAAKPDSSTFFHWALQLMREKGGFERAYSTRWWRVTVPDKVVDATVVARLNRNRDPWLVERRWQGGKVLLSTIPLDTSWRENFTGLLAYPVFVLRTVEDLADGRTTQFNLASGDALRWRFEGKDVPKGIQLKSPSSVQKEVKITDLEEDTHYRAEVLREPDAVTLVRPGMNEPGVWKMTWTEEKDAQEPRNQTAFYVVQPDDTEVDLTPMSKDDRTMVQKQVPFRFETEGERLIQDMDANQRSDLWFLFLLGLIAFLCLEVWMTRRIVKGRAID